VEDRFQGRPVRPAGAEAPAYAGAPSVLYTGSWGLERMIALEDVTLITPAGTRILTGVDLRVGAGEVYALGGDGRTALTPIADMLLGFIRPQGGSVTVNGHYPSEHPGEVRRLVTAIRWPSGLEPRLTVRANVRLLISLAGQAVSGDDAIAAALRESELPDRCFDRPAAELPPGSHRAAWLAIARLRASAVVLCDDPTTGSSDAEGTRFAGLLREFAAGGPTVLVTTGDAAFARAVADRGAVLDQGRLVFEWSRRDLPPAIPGYPPELGHGA
jgi:ABC-2 type transport system ATP-binding protein